MVYKGVGVTSYHMVYMGVGVPAIAWSIWCGCDQLSHGLYGVGVTSYHMVYMVWV